MIRITVMGDTWDMKATLKDAKFRWNPLNKTWVKTVGEASLDKTIDAIRPIKSWSDKPDPEITVILMKVDVGGNPFNLPEVRVRLQSVARPGGESVLELFNRESGSSYHQYAPPAPTNSAEALKKRQKGLDGFF